MSYAAASLASTCVGFSALVNFVSHLVAPEAHSLVAFKRFVTVLATDVAVHLLTFVSTVASEVAENAAVVAF